jgi:formylglycine-generating enzyme required for sulfatase activity
MTDIFISYNQEDRDKAKILAGIFVRQGYDVWWDVSLLPGQNFSDEINEVLKKAKAAIVLWSNKSINSMWVKSEATLALEKGILLPVWLEKVDLPLPFNTLHTIDLSHWKGKAVDVGLNELLSSITNVIGPPTGKVEEYSDVEVQKILEKPAHEVDFWKSVCNKTPQSVDEYIAYLEAYGKEGAFSKLAELRIEQIQSENNSPKYGLRINKLLAISGVVVGILVGAFQIANMLGWLPSDSVQKIPAPLSFEPEVVKINSGRYLMGCVSKLDCSESEEPLHWVSIPSFYLGKTEVTFKQWDACLNDGGCKHLPVLLGGTMSDELVHLGENSKNHPVVDVSWEDTQEYIAWLTKKTGRSYRLPSEAEWEYAARAGTQTKFHWGNEDPTCSFAAANGASIERSNCFKNNNLVPYDVRPVASFLPNAWELFDMHGSVWEWVQDCYHNNYKRAPIDGSAWVSNCEKIYGRNAIEKIVRGGSRHQYHLDLLSSANRESKMIDERDRHLGFRVARTN